MQAQNCDPIYTTGVVRLDGNHCFRWGIGRDDVATGTLDPESPISLAKAGFALLDIKVNPQATTVIARPIADSSEIKTVLGDLSDQLIRIQRKDGFYNEIVRATSCSAATYHQYVRIPVVAVLRFKRHGPDYRCFHGYGLENPDDIVDGKATTYGSKVKGIGGITAGWWMVVMFPTDKAARRFVAVPTCREDLIQMAIDGLMHQLEVAERYEKSLLDQADLG
ncbi:MAG: hypothetical protein WCV71_00595 [Patescibacteria group bacterium]